MKSVGYRLQLLIGVSLFLIILNFLIGWFMVNHAKSALKKQIHERMLDITNTAASVIDGDKYERMTDANGHSPDYQHVLSVLSSFASHTTLSYVYGLRQVGDRAFVFTIDPALTNAAEFGESAVATDALIEASTGVPSVTNDSYSDDYGSFYTAYSPIYNSCGNIVGFVAADCDVDWYDAQVRRIYITIICSCSISLFLGAAIVWLFTNRLRRRFKDLNTQMHKLAVDVDTFTSKVTGASSSLAEHHLDDYHSLLKLEQQSFDEIHELGDQIRIMRKDLQEHIDKVYSLAYKDTLTSVKSKHAWVEYELMMNHQISQHSVSLFAVAVFDVNGLKKVNDTLGHKAGDDLLKNASHMICEVFAHSPVFRIGGDEFVVVLKDRDFEHRLELMDTFNRQVDDNNVSCGVVVAAGISDFDNTSDNILQDVFARADKLMYERKHLLKTCGGIL